MSAYTFPSLLKHGLWLCCFVVLFSSCASRKVALPPEHDRKSAKALLTKYEEQTGLNLRLEQFPLYYAIDQWMGVPYKFGGTSRKGVDCSGFTQAMYRQVYKYELPRSSVEQHKKVKRVRRKRRLKEGYLVFFRFEWSAKVSHVGLYLGKGKFVHASTSKGVMINDLSQKYYKDGFLCGGKITGLSLEQKLAMDSLLNSYARLEQMQDSGLSETMIRSMFESGAGVFLAPEAADILHGQGVAGGEVYTGDLLGINGQETVTDTARRYVFQQDTF